MFIKLKNNSWKFYIILLASFLLTSGAHAERCIYTNSQGQKREVQGQKLIPKQYLANAFCEQSSAPQQILADPKDLELEGNLRTESIATSLGRMELRWPREVEKLFGRTPVRALADAARTSKMFVNLSGFRPEVRSIDLDWQVVFMSEKLPTAQIPQYLVDNCHPGWMLPPAKIYLVAERIVNGCGGKTFKPGYVADADLMKVLLHEIGHVVEFQILGQKQNRERAWAEGFASWFEQESAEYSSAIPKGEVRNFYKNLAIKAIYNSPDRFVFEGSAGDYARASMFYQAVVSRGSLAHLMDIYDYQKSGQSFFQAINSRMSWSEQSLVQEVNKYLGIR